MTVTFPLNGKICQVDYGAMIVDHDYSTPGKLTYTPRPPSPEGASSVTVDLEVVPIRDDVFALSFQDAQATVVMIEDIAAGTINTYMVIKENNALIHLAGTLSC